MHNVSMAVKYVTTYSQLVDSESFLYSQDRCACTDLHSHGERVNILIHLVKQSYRLNDHVVCTTRVEFDLHSRAVK